ncbi:MAG: lysophospholipid acyltransferase family protein [Sulfurovum sp.]|nr:lysophospholipid acyltransferase family protein [Sulfurovum sp.]
MKFFFRALGKYLLPLFGYGLMRFYWHTCKKRFHIEGEMTQTQHIVICWHGELLMSPQVYRLYHKNQGASGIVSKHFDGEIVARTFQIFGIKPLRGSSSYGAKQVLLKAFRKLKKKDDLLITPDGPRGPRHIMSNGAIALAHKAKVPVMTINYLPKSYWKLNSWDHFVIPKPFTTIDFYLKIISIDKMEIEEAREYLRRRMMEHTVI